MATVETCRVTLRTRWAEFRVAEAPLAVPAKLTRFGLSGVVNHLLQKDPPQPFDFIVAGHLLRTSLRKFLKDSGASAETVLELEYMPALRQPEAGPDTSLPDWVGAVSGGLQGGGFVTGCYDGQIRSFSAAGEEQGSGSGHSAPVKAVDVLGERVASGGQDQTAQLWTVDAEGALQLFATCAHHQDSIEALRFSPSGSRLATASWDGTLCVWDVPSPSASAAGGEATAATASKRRRGERGAAAAVAEREVVEAQVQGALVGHAQPVNGVAWLTEGQLLSASADHSIKTWDIEASNCTGTLACSKVVTDLSYSHAANLVATAHPDKAVRVWDLRADGGTAGAPAVRLCLRSHSEWVAAVAWAPNSSNILASASHDGSVKLWDIRSTLPLHSLEAHEGKALCVAWAGAETLVSGGSDSKARVFQMAAQEQ